ncbi:MAG TPA: substrate-binding domain-containing protein [Verrucomicrobiae bacterium]|nr:substrate-binding domain-containing protein [Verrucomicrobiae bacterium]
MRKIPRILLAFGWYEQRLHQGIALYAEKTGWHLCVDVTKEKVIPWGWEGDGILAWLGVGDDLADFVTQANLPTVDFSFRRPQLPFHRVLPDHAAAARLVAEHFLGHGLKHFMFYSAMANWSFDETGSAFVEILKQAGHKCDWIRWHESLEFATGHLQWKDKRRWLAQQLDQAPRPLALFAATDDHALEVLETCETIGLSVPDEISVVGLDNSLLAVNAMRTPVSSVDRNLETVGYYGAELLDKLMHGISLPKEPIRIPPAGLIVRKSSNLLTINHPGLARSLRFMWEHYHEPIQVPDLAKVASMSERSFYMAFKNHLKRSPSDELRRIRIERAKEILSDSDEKMDAVAEMCGFQSANSLWVAFKQATGMSPKQYHKKFGKARANASAKYLTI